MIRLIRIGIFTGLGFVLVAGAAVASMYWNEGQDPNETVAPTSQRVAPRAAARRSEPPALLPKMYDDGEVLQIDEGKPQSDVSPPAVRYQPPIVNPAPVRSRRIVPPAASPPRQPAVTRARSTQTQDVEQMGPQQIDSTPGQAPEKRTETRSGQPNVSGSAPARELEAVEPPITKKMPWGKEEKAEGKTNLQWGLPSQER
jgi:hypothetical protein